MLKVKTCSHLSKNPLDGFGNRLKIKIAKILMRSLYNSEKLHVNLSLLMQSF